MSEKQKNTADDPERTLMTLDQLSQTIEVMTSVVNRLRRHLSEQLREQTELDARGKEETPVASDRSGAMEQQANHGIQSPCDSSSKDHANKKNEAAHSLNTSREPFVIEIRQQCRSLGRKACKTLH